MASAAYFFFEAVNFFFNDTALAAFHVTGLGFSSFAGAVFGLGGGLGGGAVGGGLGDFFFIGLVEEIIVAAGEVAETAVFYMDSVV